MGVFADLFRRDPPPPSSSTAKRRPLSTLDIPLPQPRPARWGPRTPASLPQHRSRFGPRDPYNVYDPPHPGDYPPRDGAPSRNHGPPDHLPLDADFAALRLSAGPPATATRPPHHLAPPHHARPALAHASASAPAVYPPAPSLLANRPPALRPPIATHSLSTPPPPYSASRRIPPDLPRRPSPPHARSPAPPSRPSSQSLAAGPSSSRSPASPAQSKTSAPCRRPAPARLLPRSASAPSSATSTSDSSYRDLSPSSPTSGTASDDSLPHPSSLGTGARTPQPRTPGPARPSPGAAGSATPRAGRAKAGPTPRKRVASASAAAHQQQQQQQCAALTARSTRCTRSVRTADPALALEPASGDGGVEDGVPAYCAQHARGKLVETGCFVRARRASGGTTAAAAGAAGAERWARYADWIPEELPHETKALLRHYMALAVSPRDCHGFLYVHELVPKGSSPSLNSGSTALIKLGRSLRPLARLSQWRALCPSSEPIVRLFAPALPVFGARTSTGEPPPTGTRNHHRWERLCLVELAGRAAAAATSATPRTPCADCGRTHVECFLLPRASVVDGGWDELGWSVRETVERWARWCDDLA